MALLGGLLSLQPRFPPPCPFTSTNHFVRVLNFQICELLAASLENSSSLKSIDVSESAFDGEEAIARLIAGKTFACFRAFAASSKSAASCFLTVKLHRRREKLLTASIFHVWCSQAA